MPCFKGIAVSVHANSAPLPEHGMQKQSRLSRISTYIPVPSPSVPTDSNKPEPAKFAISITLLTPGVPIPYSAPKPTPSNPHPKPQYVGALQRGSDGERGNYNGMVTPYIPMTNSENETIAAYIYFDGRAKEEVATLLRPGEETWVNSRWVQVPDSEGGGLAEREFLFREVGLERWLNGLDLQGHDAPEKREKRRQKFEKRQRRQRAARDGVTMVDAAPSARKGRDTLRYGADDGAPLEAVMDDSDSSSDDDDEPPEATGQIKVAMFRVLASGEIKKGEYSPQFDAHDGDEDENKGGDVNADVEHTTSFAKPKTLDPQTISTQTVTGIDGPDKPYAVFTFFYRGEKQLQKAGIIPSSKTSNAPLGAAKRRSGQLDLSHLGPLKKEGTVGFSTFRDKGAQEKKSRKKSNGSMADDSDSDDDGNGGMLDRMIDADDKLDHSKLAPDDAKFSGELADGVDRIHLKRAHSAEPETANSATDAASKSSASHPSVDTPSGAQTANNAALGISDVPPEALVGSPMKRARPSVDQTNNGDKFSASQSLSAALGSVVGGGDTATTTPSPANIPKVKVEEEEEEL